jgi:glycosyltransferase involved in cell wall biosynthesis
VLQVLQPLDGGVAQHVLLLSLALRERGWRVEVAAPPACAVLPALEAAGVHVHRLPLRRSPGAGDLRVLRRLRALERGGGYGVVHAHSSKAGAVARIALGARRRVVYTPHCFAFAAGDFGPLPQAAYRLVEQALVPLTATIVAVSDWETQLARRVLRGAGSRLETIPNGVPLPASPPDPARELVEFAGGSPLALLVSKLRPQKDPLALVRAAAILRERGALAGKVAIVGDGELERRVREAIAARGLGEDVRWFPFGGASGPYLAAADLLVVPSLWESLPYAVLEAMAFGLPVLATAVGGVPEMVRDGATGRLVPPADEQALAGALAELLADAAARERMGRAARELVEQRFPLEAMVDRIEQLYERSSAVPS